MVRYLLDHAVSVFVTTAVLVALGVLAWVGIPTSLLPDIPVPEITVRVADSRLSAREMEDAVTAPLRQQLSQTGHLQDMECTSSDGESRIRMTFEYGTRMDLAYVEVNEKVDGAMNSLPKDCPRPLVSKINASDIPVFTLVVCPKSKAGNANSSYSEVSGIVRDFVRPRLEQLPEVSMADVSGIASESIVIRLNAGKAAQLGVDSKAVEDAFRDNNVDAGTATLKDRGVVYNVRMEASLKSAEEIRNIYMSRGGRIFRLKDIADVEYVTDEGDGRVLYNGRKAVAVNVMKRPNVKMSAFRKHTHEVVTSLQRQFPEADFRIFNDQAQLLQATIDNLVQNLWLGLLLVFVVSAVFLRNMRLPLIVAVSMVSALVISVGVMYLFGISLNIVSLVGLILAVGMMIDNSLIVADDITQYVHSGMPLRDACAKGTNEVITPMLSSMLTTVVVFFPLVFVDGMAGEVFRDQAYTITIGLAVSYLVAIMFLPVLYEVVFWKAQSAGKVSDGKMARFYDKGIELVFNHKKAFLVATVMSLPLCLLLYKLLPHELMPSLDRHELVAGIDWGNGATVEQSSDNTQRLLDGIRGNVAETYSLVGRQGFANGSTKEQQTSQSHLFFTVGGSEKNTDNLENKIGEVMRRDFPQAEYTLSPPMSVMEAVFPADRKQFGIKVRESGATVPEDSVALLGRELHGKLGVKVVLPETRQQIEIMADRRKMKLYGMGMEEVEKAFSGFAQGNALASVRNGGRLVPVVLTSSDAGGIDTLVSRGMVQKSSGNGVYPVRSFISLREWCAFGKIMSDFNGQYVPIGLDGVTDVAKAGEKVDSVMAAHPHMEYSFYGSVFKVREMLRSMAVILFVSLVLMYLIMTAQFGSFVQPLILLTEIPVDIAAGLLLLFLSGHSLNIMSAIGLVVTCGVVVNDSILKVNVINDLRNGGTELKAAIHEAGRRRLRAIVMTSLTSIFAMIPILFSFDIGSEMQKPFAIAMIGSMVVGTLYSLFVVPLLYWCVYRRNEP